MWFNRNPDWSIETTKCMWHCWSNSNKTCWNWCRNKDMAKNSSEKINYWQALWLAELTWFNWSLEWIKSEVNYWQVSWLQKIIKEQQWIVVKIFDKVISVVNPYSNLEKVQKNLY